MRCTVIFNPASGRNRHRRAERIREIAETLSSFGHRVQISATAAPNSATIQAQDAARRGADIVFACGGDGTVNEVLQGLVSETGLPTAALGVIPLGSANALARHMRLSLDPLKAALQGIEGTLETIPIGKLTYGNQVRYFAVMAGAGPDGALVYKLLTAHKSSLGSMAYYLDAARLFATRRFHSFEIEFTDEATGNARTQTIVAVMAVRVDDLGGIFSKLVGGKPSIRSPHFRVAILRPPATLSLPLWFASGWLGLHKLNPFLRLVDVSGFSCRSYSDYAAHFQADGEWLGRLPMRVSIVPNALRLLIPSK